MQQLSHRPYSGYAVLRLIWRRSTVLQDHIALAVPSGSGAVHNLPVDPLRLRKLVARLGRDAHLFRVQLLGRFSPVELWELSPE